MLGDCVTTNVYKRNTKVIQSFVYTKMVIHLSTMTKSSTK